MDDLGKSRKELIEKMHGELQGAKSTPDRSPPQKPEEDGEALRSPSQPLRAPRQEAAAGKTAEVRQRQAEQILAPPKTPSEPPMWLHGRILVVEDSTEIQRLMRLFLTKVGLEVTPATNGQLALEAALPAWEAGETFDVILMDMQMPVLDGYRATELLRAVGYPGTIVALTAHAIRGERQRCLAAGCNDYLKKPIDRTTLLTTLARYLPVPLGNPN